MAEEPIFYCENCGAVVNNDDSRCANCGKRFDGVKCPRCQFQGKSSQFAKGCPKCHYQPGDDITPIGANKSHSKHISPYLTMVFICAILLLFALYNFAT